MKNNKLLKTFIKYVSLNIIGMLGLSIYILADTYFVSKALGASGLSALNLAIPIYSFVNGIGLMLGIGGATKYSISKGQKNKARANSFFTNTLILGIFFSLLFLILGIFFSKSLIILLGANKEILFISKTYLQILLLFSPMFILNNIMLCFIRNDGNPTISMISMILGSVSNIILDYIFMFYFHMGMFGAALATGIAPIISLTILSSFIFNKKNKFHIIKYKFSISQTIEQISSGIPSLITEVSSGIVMIVFNSVILKISGNIGVAAYGIIANLSLVVISIYTGIAQGIQPILSNFHGLNEGKNIKTTLKYSLITVFVFSIIIYITFFIKNTYIVNIFNSGKNLQLQKIAEQGLLLYFLSCFFIGFNIIISIYFTSIELTRPAHIISILRGFIIIIPVVFLFSHFWGIAGVWLALPVSEFIVFIISTIIFSKIKHTR